MTLLDKAKTSGAQLRPATTEQPEGQLVELGLAWLRGEIRNVQLTEALGRKKWALAGCVITCMNAVRRAVVAGKIKIR